MCFYLTGTRVWEQSKVQRGKVHHRAGTHDQRQRMGVMLLFSLSDLGMLFSELHGAMTIDHLAPSRAPLKRKTPRTSTPSPLSHAHTPSCSSWEGQNGDRGATGVLWLLWRVCVLLHRAGFLGSAFLTLPSPNHANKWLWCHGDHYANGDRLHWEDMCLFSLCCSPSETGDDLFLMLFTISLSSEFQDLVW